MTTQADIQSLTSLLCCLVTYEVEITQVLEDADQDTANYLDFRHDLAHAIATALDPETDPTREAMALVGDLVTEWEQAGATIQDHLTQDQETTTND